jgi:tetratricopeptide (TPR) repeat protein
MNSKLLFAVWLAALPMVSAAQSTDAEFRPLVNAGRLPALIALANERLALAPADEVALWYLGRHGTPDARRREVLLAAGEQCVRSHPQSARCHNLLGHLYGAMAVSAGLTGGLKYAGKVRESFAEAVALEPSRYEFRRDLNQFYLLAPGIVGGSVRKAAESSADFARHSAAHSSLLLAEVHIYKKEFERAEALLASVSPGTDAHLRADLDLTLRSLGNAWLAAGQAERAEELFERQITPNGNVPSAYLGLGRAQLALQKVDAAMASLEKALSLDPALPAHYPLGLAYEAKGDKTKAMSALRLYLAKHPNGAWASEARNRLQAL